MEETKAAHENRTIVALFGEAEEAQKVIHDLLNAGFAKDKISLVANKATCAPALGPIESIDVESGPGAGIAVGSVAGFALGLFALSIPGIGLVLAAGPLAGALMGAGLGAAAGGAIGLLKQHGIHEDDAHCLCEAVRQGGVILTVLAPENRATEAEEILGRAHLVDLDDCREAWQQAGWKGFEHKEEPKVEAQPTLGLPFDPKSVKVGQQRQRRGVRSYFRVT
ncbi:MAG: hypothetical protein IPM24_13440 [Bryobacterales bacterium]|nr:hypothetical protein [Bryobacterales bacterium]